MEQFSAISDIARPTRLASISLIYFRPMVLTDTATSVPSRLSLTCREGRRGKVSFSRTVSVAVNRTLPAWSYNLTCV